ncbi:MAG TPA: ATP-binding protein [Clostridia bacterium]|nr:MAG: Serine/threonine-protein kinase RsbT [Firmicutes bacterium ADurb.Bin248]HOG00564.1 ATP-binding protein [Clostridia bacterium]HOS18752.1 ATP-binding protein [Clostridia bacterium]HPK14773.1 ATP-binding protein [Clostridia bacterium]
MTGPIYRESYSVERGNFATAGDASRAMKNTLKRMGVDPAIIRDVAIASYELELNLVIHSAGGSITLEIFPDRLRLTCADRGPGIPDISLALQEGYSTATQEVRNMGFGAGMGLPNIRRHSHEFDIESAMDAGTTITSQYRLMPNDGGK